MLPESRRDGGACESEVVWQITQTPLLLVNKVAVKGYPILASPLSVPPSRPCCHNCCYYICILAIQAGSITLLARGQHMYTDTQTCGHFATPVEHGCQAAGRGGRKGKMYSFAFHCAQIECWSSEWARERLIMRPVLLQSRSSP